MKPMCWSKRMRRLLAREETQQARIRHAQGKLTGIHNEITRLVEERRRQPKETNHATK